MFVGIRRGLLCVWLSGFPHKLAFALQVIIAFILHIFLILGWIGAFLGKLGVKLEVELNCSNNMLPCREEVTVERMEPIVWGSQALPGVKVRNYH